MIISDINGCLDTVSKSVTVNPNPAVTGTVSDVTCAGMANGLIDITPSGNGPFTYLWQNSATGEDLVNIPPGSYSVTVTDMNSCTTSANFQVNEPQPIIISSTATYVSCNGGNDGAIDITVNGGIPPYNFSWSNGSTTEDLTGIAAGWHVLSVTDANNCLAIDSVFVQEPPPLDTSVIINDVSCNGGNDGSIILITAGGVPPYTFNWSGGQMNDTIQSLSAGTYGFTITDSNNCTLSGNIVVKEPQPLSVSAQVNHVSCYGFADGMIDITLNGGTPAYSFLWSNAATGEDLTNIPPGLYELTVTDANSCTVQDSFIVNEPDSLTLQFTYGDVRCYGGNDGYINTLVSGGTIPYTYNWSDNNNQPNRNGLTAGTYALTVTDGNSCSITGQVQIGQPAAPAINAITTDVTCFGGSDGAIDLSVAGGTPPYQFNWSNGAQSEDISSINAGQYFVTITDSNNCVYRDTFSINEPPELLITNVQLSDYNGFNISCYNVQDGSIDISPSGGVPPYTYNWSNNFTGEDPVNLPAGNYQLTLSDNNGCTLSATYTLSQPDSLIAIPQIVNATCYGYADGSITVNTTGGTGNYTFNWSHDPAINSPVVTNLPVGNYGVTVMDDNGCGQHLAATISSPPPLVVAIDSVEPLYLGETADLQVSVSRPVNSYQWNPVEGLSCHSCPDPEAMPVSTTLYSLTVTDSAGCQASDSLTIYINEDKIIYIPNAFSPNADGLNDVFTIYTSGVRKSILRIYNRWGELLFESYDIAEGWNGYDSKNGNAMEPGVYVYQLYLEFIDNTSRYLQGSVTLLK